MKIAVVGNDEADAEKQEETPVPLRHLIHRRNLVIDQGFGSLATADNLEAGIPLELGDGDFTKTQQILSSIYEYLGYRPFRAAYPLRRDGKFAPKMGRKPMGRICRTAVERFV